MASIFETEQGLFLRADDGYELHLNENNTVLHLHRDVPGMDVMGIEDPRDEAWWQWWRCDRPPQEFEHLAEVGKRVGTVMMRSTPLETTETSFNAYHQVKDDEISKLLEEGSDGTI